MAVTVAVTVAAIVAVTVVAIVAVTAEAIVVVTAEAIVVVTVVEVIPIRTSPLVRKDGKIEVMEILLIILNMRVVEVEEKEESLMKVISQTKTISNLFLQV